MALVNDIFEFCIDQDQDSIEHKTTHLLWRTIWQLYLWATVSSFSSHLGGEHVSNAVNRPSQQQTSHQETEQHHVREEGAEVHHLSESQSARLQCYHGYALLRLCSHSLFLSLLRTHTLTHTQPWMNLNPKTALCLLILNLWNLTKCGEDSMRSKDMSQKSFLQHFGESFQYCLW